MRVTAVIPVKALKEAKSRLDPVLAPARRRELVLEMLGHVLGVVSRAPLHRVLVVTRDREVASLAASAGGEWIPDPAATLNESLADVFRTCWERREAPLYLPADLPRLEADDLRSLCGAADEVRTVVLSPSHDERGTNALLVPAGHLLLPSLGVDSFPTHLKRANDLGVATRVYRSPGLGLDIDTPEDLLSLSTNAAKWTGVPAH